MAARGAPRFASFQPRSEGGEQRGTRTEYDREQESRSGSDRNSRDLHEISRLRKSHKHKVSERRHRHHSSPNRARHGTDRAICHEHGVGQEPVHPGRSRESVPIYVIDRFGDPETAKYKYQSKTAAVVPQKKRPSKSIKSTSRSNELESFPMANSAMQSTPVAERAADFLPLEVSAPEEPTTSKDYNDLYQRVRKLQPNVSQNDPPVFAEGSVQDLSRHLHRQVMLDPTDLEAWFKLAELQARMIPNDPEKELTQSDEANIARMQIAVLDRAEAACERNHKCLPLVIARLQLTSEAGICSSHDLLQIWTRTLQDFSSQEDATFADMGHLFWAYVQFRKGDAATFTVDSFWEVCCEALQMPARFTSLRDKEEESMHVFRVSIVRELCVVLRSAGYFERAYGLLQALLELHLGDLNQEKQSESHSEQLWEALRVWWDAELPRIGELLPYTGFDVNMKLNTKDQSGFFLQNFLIPSLINTDSDEINDCMDPMSWHRKELESGYRSRYPQKLQKTTPAQLHDPFSFVFFEDIRNALFMPVSNDPWSTIRIADVFLEMLGLPSRWCSACLQFGLPNLTEPILTRNYPRIWPKKGMSELSAKFWSDAQWLDSSCNGHTTIQNVALTSDTLFQSTASDPRGVWFASLQNIPPDVARLSEVLIVHLGHRLFQSGKRHLSIKLAIPHAMLCVAAGQPNDARKVLRAALQQDDQQLLLWYAYAQLELNIWGNIRSVRRLLVQVLGFDAYRNRSADSYATSLLWSLWVEVEWSLNEENRCLHILANAAECGLNTTKDLSTSQLQQDDFTKPHLGGMDKLKLRKTFQELINRSLHIPDTHSQLLPGLVICSALTELLIQDVPVGDQMIGPCAIFHKGLTTKNRKIQSEVAVKFQRFLQLVNHVSPHTPIRLRELRANTITLLKLDRWNSCHLQMLASREQHFKTDGIVKEVLGSDVLHDHRYGSAIEFRDKSNQSFSHYEEAEQAWLLAIAARIHTRCNLDDILPLLKASINTMRRSSLLWHVIISWELQRLSNPSALRLRERTKAYQNAKTWIYQAIHNCPYDKALYLLAFDPRLEPVFDVHELYALARIMEEKQLRIFQNLEEPVAEGLTQDAEPSDDTQSTLDRISSFLYDIQASATTS